MTNVTFSLVIIINIFCLCYCAQLPSNFGRCHTKDKEFDECIRKNIEVAIHSLKEGSTQLGLHPFEPLSIPQLIIGQGTGAVNVEQRFSDAKLYGLTGSLVQAGSVDFEKEVILAKSVTPNLQLIGTYDMNGKILLLPLVGTGPFNVTLVNTKINHTITGQAYEKKGKKYWKFVNYTVTLRPERVYFRFDNLYNGSNPQLGENVNQVLNDNWDEVFTDVRPGYEASFGQIFQDLANRVFSRVALKDIFYFD
ncbi:unnamed protein product [Brassicogethes aeneus]|uniref:Uncharacterized protein n=1 Tax=Brassicogethes aeneus TaxID=1431903 RepID=A0A9P0AUW6_BRAAE|nr:unnamed protein product [Brassicogethes aeneus]